MNDNNPMRNGAGYMDPTAGKAIIKADKDRERLSKLVHTIFDICDLAGFRVEGRITLKDKKTGTIYK